MHSVESELIKATGYKAQRKFADRQDYLGSILNAVMKLSDDDFDELSDDAALWTNAAVKARNENKGKDAEIPDFDEVAPSDDEDGDEDEAEEASNDHDPETGEVIEDEEPSDTTDSDVSEDEAETSDSAEAAVPDSEGVDEPEADEPPAKPVKAKKAATEAKPKKQRSEPIERNVCLDKWGSMEGTKASQALAMFEKGATTREVKEALGGTYYNILGRCVKAGHVLKKEGAVVTLIHADDLVGAKSGKAAIPTKKAKK